MATKPVKDPASSHAYINALQWGGWHWGDSARPNEAVVIRYYLEDFRGHTWSPSESNAIKSAFKTWSNVANIKFEETQTKADAQLIERQLSNADTEDALGFHGTPDVARTGSSEDGLILGGLNQAYGYFNQGVWSDAGLRRGGYDFLTLVHELGHGLGLAHPHDKGGGSKVFPGVTEDVSESLGNAGLNQGIFTVMSYNDAWLKGPSGSRTPAGVTSYGYQAGPMAFDIAAIQDLYGANTTTNRGNNLYKLPDANKAGTYWSCIWDTGGTDGIRYDGKRNTTIDLIAATLDESKTGGGAPSYATNIRGGYTIANGVVIENAIGGSGKDKLYGNSSANVLNGRNGDDTIEGRGGGDTYIGGNGHDTFYVVGGGNTIIGGNGIDILSYVKHQNGLCSTFKLRRQAELA